MYKKTQNRQMCIEDFDQPMGLKMDPENRWIKKAAIIPWDVIEEKYAALFASHTGMPAKPLRMALGALLIQKEYDYPDRELVQQIRENPYYQYFIGLPGYQAEAPFVPSLLVEFRKRLDDETICEINELILKSIDDGKPPEQGAGGAGNSGTLILDATCAPQDIRYPQDTSLLNEAREKADELIDSLCYEHNFYRPRTYRDIAKREYLAFARSKKRSKKKIRKATKKQLQYLARNLGHIDVLLQAILEDDFVLEDKYREQLDVITKLYGQQKYMYDNDTHSVEDRIVSIGQPHLRPIVRGKAAAPVEFGAKLDLSMAGGYGRIEKMSFDAYNESSVLQGAVERYRERTGRYPERVLVDKIYRNCENIAFCKERGIRISGPALGRPKNGGKIDKKQALDDGVDRIAIERAFSLAKRNYGLGLIRMKREDTTRGAIAISILAMNIGTMVKASFCPKTVFVFSRFMCKVHRPKALVFAKNFERLALGAA
jgi:GR25 family glycosyltransferase involved in LPS biosynthesis